MNYTLIIQNVILLNKFDKNNGFWLKYTLLYLHFNYCEQLY